MSKLMDNKTVRTGICTFSYLNCWEPKSVNGSKPKYSVSLIIPKSDTRTIDNIRAAIKAAYEDGQSTLKGNGRSVPALSDLRTPLRDGDRERPDDDAYGDSFFLNAKSEKAPGIVDADRVMITEHSEMYSGVKGRAVINMYPYNVNGNRGIACCLQHLQKISDGTPLGGRTRAEDAFADDDEDDFLN